MGRLLLVRHGQASFGADDYDVLSPAGWEQGRLLGAWLNGLGTAPDVVVHGGLRRQRETAEAVLTGGAWSSGVTVDPGWAEFDHLAVLAADPDAPGPDVELDRRGFQAAFEAATARWTAGGRDTAYPEPWPDFLSRVRTALDAACALAGPGGTALVVSSGGPIAAACAALVDPDGDDPARARLWSRLNTVVVNASVSRVLVGAGGARLLTFNEHPHVAGDLLTYR